MLHVVDVSGVDAMVHVRFKLDVCKLQRSQFSRECVNGIIAINTVMVSLY